MARTAVDVLEDLQAAGFGEREAKAVVRAVASLTAAELATKTDLLETRADLKAELAETRADLKAELAETKAELKAEIAETKAELKADLAGTKAELQEELKALEIRLIKWYVATSILLAGTVAMIVALIK